MELETLTIDESSLKINTECQELKNIKYKTMLLNGVTIHETKSANNLVNLEKFLEDEQNNNVNEPWCKLNKTVKNTKMQIYIKDYILKNNFTEEESNLLNIFLKDCLERKKLQRVKDVIYDKENGIIKDIPALCYMKLKKHFTLKNLDAKRVSTLKSLAPKKAIQGTIRKKEGNETVNYDSDEDD
jgi:hypothetical protein